MKTVVYQRNYTWLIWLFLAVIIIIVFMPANYCVYQTYILRSKVAAGLTLASSAKRAVTENAKSGLPFTFGWVAPNVTVDVSSIAINPNNGIITISYTDKIAKGSPTLVLIPKVDAKLLVVNQAVKNAVMDWECHADTAPEQDEFRQILGTILSEYVPSICRSQQSKQKTMTQIMKNIISVLKCECECEFAIISTKS